MLNKIQLRFNQLIEKFRNEGMYNTITKELLFFNKKIIVFEKDLTQFQSVIQQSDDPNSHYAKFDSNTVLEDYVFPNRSRYLKAVSSIKKGHELFVFIRGNKIIGDCWFATYTEASKKDKFHPDVKMLHINPVLESVYMFDMYIIPEERGKNITRSILLFAFNNFKARNLSRIYTYVLASNTPAIWMVRTLGFKETNKLNFHRLVSFRMVTS